jgi:CheY-like chemotaxis protein
MTSEAPRLNALAGVRVLVVEDDPDLREGVVECLEMEGAKVAGAGTGDAGFDTFVRERPDVILSDLWMPGGSGLDFIQRVRGLPPEEGGLTPGIAMSAAGSERPALLAGFHVFIAKPFDPLRLIDTVADFAQPGHAHAPAPWTIALVEPGKLLITHAGHVGGGDMRAMMAVLRVHLEQSPVELVVDLRRPTTFAPSAMSVAQRSMWSLRGRILAIRFVGGSFGGRLLSAASCKLLGIPCTFAEAIEGSDRSEP